MVLWDQLPSIRNCTKKTGNSIKSYITLSTLDQYFVSDSGLWTYLLLYKILNSATVSPSGITVIPYSLDALFGLCLDG